MKDIWFIWFLLVICMIGLFIFLDIKFKEVNHKISIITEQLEIDEIVIEYY